ncbi:hypothetical protein DID75_04770 [Candidatus Marinamargulisbacteria bacterium SCGC AG-410-N11]|nr:hypothetical protein DID75_04770 [Candidatus Marinamargulisbacteria bacterium SCGC AG-410-N11]
MTLSWFSIPLDRLKKIIWISVPIIGGMLSQNILGLIDTFMVGYIGDYALAAVGVGSVLYFFSTSFITGIVESIQVYVARFFGENNRLQCLNPLILGVGMNLIIATTCTVMLWLLCPLIFKLVNPDPIINQLGVHYFRCLILSLPLFSFNLSIRSYWNGVNKPGRYLMILIPTHLCNIFFNWVFIFGHLGSPELGVTGAGLATSLAMLLGSCIYLVSCYVWIPDFVQIKKYLNLSLVPDMVKLAIPSSVRQFFFCIGVLILYWIIGFLGAQSVAIANVLINIALIVILPGVGFGLTSMSLVSQALGRKDKDDANQWGWDVVKVASFVTLVIGGISFFLPEVILGVFIQNPETLKMAIAPFRLDCLTIWIEVIGLVLLSSLVGIGRSASVLRVTLACQYLLFVPLGYYLGAILKKDLVWIFGAWTLYQSAVTLSFLIMWFRAKYKS